jgi:hypothetical protein
LTPRRIHIVAFLALGFPGVSDSILTCRTSKFGSIRFDVVSGSDVPRGRLPPVTPTAPAPKEDLRGSGPDSSLVRS